MTSKISSLTSHVLPGFIFYLPKKGVNERENKKLASGNFIRLAQVSS